MYSKLTLLDNKKVPINETKKINSIYLHVSIETSPVKWGVFFQVSYIYILHLVYKNFTNAENSSIHCKSKNFSNAENIKIA
jgi:hypothetical protein